MRRHTAMRCLLIGVSVLLAHAAHEAHAATMLRCEADDHSVVYVSARIDHAHCSSIAMNWRPGGDTAASDAKGRVPPMRREATTRIYTYVEDGVRHFLSNRPTGVDADVSVIQLHFMETCNLCAPDASIDVAALLLDTRSYRREIDASASAFGVDHALVRAVIHAESAYRTNALSRAGAQGLMQLMPATATRFGVGDPFDAGQNIRGGVEYLSWLLKRFGGNLDLALAAYNSGETTVDRYNGVPPYAETQRYVTRVKALADRYRSGR
ncbi:lytic transglycosylase domain-containing protein [Caballeronia sp. BR00000012568055]|uniref:lytic transglycosylase domain-containing protein n=1 Tax=Caballeronia sp. BR00000012568055 TaxID=2918761 RepID=UPI0023F6A53E|nr:lytic transglycosylase domain-containing protein [Caballeronia sp. BR00000012568055]